MSEVQIYVFDGAGASSIKVLAYGEELKNDLPFLRWRISGESPGLVFNTSHLEGYEGSH